MTETAAWTYGATWCREDEGGGRDTLNAHMQEMAALGWELVSGNAVWVHWVETTDPGHVYQPARTGTTGVVRHYLYWRVRVQATGAEQA